MHFGVVAFVSTRHRRYERYLDATDHARMFIPRYKPDAAHLATLFGWTKDYYAGWNSFFSALLKNDRYLHSLSYQARQEELNLTGGVPGKG